MESGATQEQPLTLLTITAPVDRPDWALRIVNDNDWFSRDVVGLTQVTGLCVKNNSTDRITLSSMSSDFFIPAGPPADAYMYPLAFFRLAWDGGLGDADDDGPYQVKTIEDKDNAIIYKRTGPWLNTGSNAVGLFYQETFIPANFAATLSRETQDTVPSVDISIGLNDPQIVADLSALTESPKVVVEVVLRSEPDFSQYKSSPVDWSSIGFDRNGLSGSITGPSPLNIEVPRDSRTPFLRPGLFNNL